MSGETGEFDARVWSVYRALIDTMLSKEFLSRRAYQSTVLIHSWLIVGKLDKV
jgi:hypothetical protein